MDSEVRPFWKRIPIRYYIIVIGLLSIGVPITAYNWKPEHYAFFKDFSAPMATALAALVAAYLTWSFGKAQANIAQRQASTANQQAEVAQFQAKTALDRLRYDLFEKRYKIYETTKELIRYVSSKSIQDQMEATEIIVYTVVMDEAPFFFPEEICELTADIQKLCWKIAGVSGERLFAKQGDPNWLTLSKELYELNTSLANLSQGLPARFSGVLSFEQLTRSPI